MKLLLTGDVGGTKTLLSLIKSVPNHQSETLHSDRFNSQNYSSLKDIIQQFFQEAAVKLGYTPEVDTACFGIAGPVANNTSYLTNLGWQLNGNQLQTELGIEQVELINDFAAVGYGVLGLDSADLYTLQVGERQPQAPIAVIGAGTGLGQGFLTWNYDHYQVYASEGGHTDFAPRSPREMALLNFLLTRHERVSTERVVSGKGIVSIYQFLKHNSPEPTELYQLLQAWEGGDHTIDMGAAIAKATLNKTDEAAMETIQIFLDAYAAEIGNLALKLLPYGGLYIAGGITPKLLSLISSCEGSGENNRFLHILKHKGRVSPMLDTIPIHIVLNQNVGLIGTILHGSYLQQARNKGK
ncbi:glucokinase [Synechococcus sp. PCC 7502]|uniref:glucokinase n=1 Tax=Synechococcus sp. PCC 7502 TaxID=1173263 RepID=UPI00029FEDA7|nr:glucokinase [Synechococcus sp. PCC 7502]AFY74610.1 glucokinase [Synechococcus sp. PCC 7502]